MSRAAVNKHNASEDDPAAVFLGGEGRLSDLFFTLLCHTRGREVTQDEAQRRTTSQGTTENVAEG